MIYILIIFLFGICGIDILKNKKILSPSFVFNFTWFITLFLYQFRLSYIQQDLSIKTTLIFFFCIVSYNLTLLLLSFIKDKGEDINFGKFKIDDKVRVAKYIVIFLFIVEVIYSKGFPVLWKIIGSKLNYFDYGIPSLHGAFCGLVICLGAYSLYKNTKDKYLYFGIGVLLISRQILISMIVEWLVITVFNKNIKSTLKKLVLVGIICIVGFNILGNFRSGNNVMNDVFQARPQYEKLPSGAKWIYSYMTFSVSNFNNLVKLTDGNVNQGTTMLGEVIPTVILKKINLKNKHYPNFLVSPNYTVSTYLPSIYLDFGIVGIVIFNCWMALLGLTLYNNLLRNKNIKNLLLYSVFVHNIMFLFFNNMFLYLPIMVQFAYIIILFSEKKEEPIKPKKKQLVSIIVPVHNVEKFINKCVDSILNQSYKNIEVLLIDDGSTDNSGKICDEYALCDKRVITVHKENGGLSSARNCGLKYAKGKYIAFVDSDDYIDTNMIEKLYFGCVNNNVDIAWCDKIIENEHGKQHFVSLYDSPKLINQKEAYKNILLNDPSVCDKLYKKKVFDNISFPEGKLYEDILTTDKIIGSVDNVYHIGESCYHYYQRTDSIVHNKFSKKKLDYIENAKILYLSVVEKHPDLTEAADCYYILVLCTVICDMYESKNKFKDEYNKILLELKNSRKQVYKNKYIPFTKKIMYDLIVMEKLNLVNKVKKIKDVIKFS